MTTHTLRSIALSTALAVLAAPAVAAAQDSSLTRAKTYYASANYEDALQVLAAMTDRTAPGVRTEAALYELFCLVALDRADEARQSVTTIVQDDPLYRPSEALISPRVRAFFDEVRRPLLPEQARRLYARAKEAFDRKDMAVAETGFERTLAIVNEIGADGPKDVADLRTLAVGFRDLSRAALEAETEAAAKAAAEKAAAAKADAGDAASGTPTSPGATAGSPLLLPPGVNRSPDAPRTIYSPEDKQVTPPVTIRRVLPQWAPSDPIEARQSFSGVLELVIDESGRVILAKMAKAIHPRYDQALLQAAQEWTFKPATWAGVPVPFRYRLSLTLGR